MAGQISNVNGFTGATGYVVTGSASYTVTHTAVVGNSYRFRTAANSGGAGFVVTGGNVQQATTTSVVKTVTSPIPAAGVSQPIYLQEALAATPTTWADTGTVGAVIAITPSVVNTTQTFSTATTTTISHTIALSTTGVGGTFQYATSSSATYNTSLINTWQTSPTFTLTRGNTYYLWVRQADGAAYASSSGAQLVPDMTPDTYTALAANLTNAGHSNVYWASWSAATPPVLGGSGSETGYTVAGLTAGVSTTATATNGTFCVGSAFGTQVSTGQVSNGTVIFFRAVASAAASTPITYTLQIGTQPRSFTITTGAVVPDRFVNMSTNPVLANGGVISASQTTITCTVTGGTSGHEYGIFSNSVFANVLRVSAVANASGIATLVIPNSGLPTSGNSFAFGLAARVPSGIGGNDIWSPLANGSLNGAAAADFLWSWSRASLIATTLGVGTVSRTPAGDISGGATSVVVNFTGTIAHKYKLVQTAPSVADMVVGSVLGATGATSLTLTSAASALPGENNTWTYKVQVVREIADNGDGIWYDATGTGVSFTILRIYNPTVSNDQGFDTTYNSSFFSHDIKLKVAGDGGIEEYAYEDASTSPGTYPTTWSSSKTCVVVRGSSYYFWARRRAPGGPATDPSDFDRIDAAVQVPEWQGINVTGATYGIQISNASGVPVLTMSSRIARLLDVGTTSAVAAGGTYTSPVISSIDTYINSHVAVISPNDATYKLSSFSVSTNYTAKTFSIINNTGTSKTYTYYVFRSG